MSNDFFEMVLPNPELSVDVNEVFEGLRVDNSNTCDDLRDSIVSIACPLACKRPLALGSVSRPLEAIGDGCLLGKLAEGFSTFPFTVTATPGLDLPAESGLSGNVVRRFGGVSREKSGRIIGCGGGLIRVLGELGRDDVTAVRPFDGTRPTEAEGAAAGDKEGAAAGDERGAEFRRVGVEGREADLVAGLLKFAEIWGLEVGVEGLEFWDGLVLSMEELVSDGRALEGVEDRDDAGRADGVEGLAVDEERAVGVDGLV